MEQKDMDLFANIVTKAVEPLSEKLDNLEGRFDNLEGRFDNLENRIDSLESKVDRIDLDVRDIKVSIENEIKPQISVIAEAHSILNRKLDDYIRHVLNVEDEREQLKLKMIYLENELARVKERLNAITQLA